MARTAINITVDEFIQLHHIEGKKYNEIAQLKGMKPNALSNWKWSNKVKIEEALSNSPQPDTAEVKPSETNTTQDWKATEYKRVIEELKRQLDEAKNKLKSSIETNEVLTQTIEEKENLHAACEDIENELASLREENAKLVKQGHHDSYIISNQKYQLEKWAMENEALQEENQALKYFARKYLA